MQHLLLLLLTVSPYLSASEHQPSHTPQRRVTICLHPQPERVVTLHLNTAHNTKNKKTKQCKKPRAHALQTSWQQDPTKKYKRAFMQRSPAKIQDLVQAGCPQNKSEQRQKAVLAILARTQDETLKEVLFTTGLDAGSFTRETAARLGAAMKMQGRKLINLAQKNS